MGHAFPRVQCSRALRGRGDSVREGASSADRSFTPHMSLDPRALAVRIAEAAWDKKAVDLRVLDVHSLVQITDYFVICSGNSDRQVIAIADSIEEKLRKIGHRPLAVEGRQWGRWICMDYNDVVVHIFYQEVRELYDLESLWAEAPVLDVQDPAAGLQEGGPH